MTLHDAPSPDIAAKNVSPAPTEVDANEQWISAVTKLLTSVGSLIGALLAVAGGVILSIGSTADMICNNGRVCNPNKIYLILWIFYIICFFFLAVIVIDAVKDKSKESNNRYEG